MLLCEFGSEGNALIKKKEKMKGKKRIKKRGF